MSIAASAVENALQIEAKKHALRQQQDGCWILTMKIHQNDMPSEIMKAPMGARYVVALVEVGDDEQPINREEVTPPIQLIPSPRFAQRLTQRRAGADPINRKDGDAPEHTPNQHTDAQPRSTNRAGADKPKSPAQIAGFLCTTLSFQRFLWAKYYDDWRECAQLFWPNEPQEQIAAEVVRLRCHVRSRSEIKPDNRDWVSLMGDYRAWEKEPEVMG